MTQEIIVYIILAVSIIFIIYRLVKKNTSAKPDPCNSCTGCDLKEIKECSKPRKT